MPHAAQPLLYRVKTHSLCKLNECSIIIRSIIKHEIAQVIIGDAKMLQKWMCVCVCVCMYLTSGGARALDPRPGEPRGL